MRHRQTPFELGPEAESAHTNGYNIDTNRQQIGTPSALVRARSVFLTPFAHGPCRFGRGLVCKRAVESYPGDCKRPVVALCVCLRVRK